ncbi:hypothetical protein [Asticcacaulis sp. MM231]|uniref:hypothetical protein n=1 Tax=Asticcacaulis sp. MM231 TaxID=3157666 RepID=UPI0032D56D08
MSRLSNFSFKAVQIDGKTRHGQIMAVNEAEVYAKLRADNLSPLSIRVKAEGRAGAGTSLPKWLTVRKGLSDFELEELFQSLAVLLRAGADIRTALGVLSSDNEVMKDVSTKISGGRESRSRAWYDHSPGPDAFEGFGCSRGGKGRCSRRAGERRASPGDPPENTSAVV